MMEYKRVNMGLLIEQKINEKRIKKSEFARMINMQSQNINRSILDRETIEIDKLVEISEALDFDFFQYYHPIDYSRNETLAETKICNEETQLLRDEILKLRAENNILKQVVGIRGEESEIKKGHVG